MRKPGSGSLKKALQACPKGKQLFILLICLTFAAPLTAQLYKLDQSTLVEFTEHRRHEPAEFWQFISNSTNYTSLGIPAALYIGGLAADDPQMKRNALHIGESILVSSALTFAAKYTFQRPRPATGSADITAASNAGSPSLPSGHTSEAFATATALSLAYPKWYVIVPAYMWAGSVGYSRMYLGVHYPTDVTAGAVLGITSAYLTRRANTWLQHRHERKTLMLP